jgi:ABC-type multidrug transport system fused ATPase/permease subunit
VRQSECTSCSMKIPRLTARQLLRQRQRRAYLALLRFYEPDSGNVMIDCWPAMQYSLSELRGNMAFVPQEVLLFGGSIEANIRGRPDASREEILAASRQAACHEFIERFPEGYDTVVGERGVKLSGGACGSKELRSQSI